MLPATPEVVNTRGKSPLCWRSSGVWGLLRAIRPDRSAQPGHFCAPDGAFYDRTIGFQRRQQGPRDSLSQGSQAPPVAGGRWDHHWSIRASFSLGPWGILRQKPPAGRRCFPRRWAGTAPIHSQPRLRPSSGCVCGLEFRSLETPCPARLNFLIFPKFFQVQVAQLSKLPWGLQISCHPQPHDFPRPIPVTDRAAGQC